MLPNSSGISATCFGTLNHREMLLVGAQNGFELLRYNGISWELKHHVNGFNFPVLVLEDLSGESWVSSLSSLYKVRFNVAIDNIVYWKEYPAGRGLPYENGFPFRLNSGEVIISTEPITLIHLFA